MKRDKEHLNLRGAYKPVPEGFEQAVQRAARAVSRSAPAPGSGDHGREKGRMPRRAAVIVAVCLLLLGMAAACAAARPALLDWLLGLNAADEPYPASAALASTVQQIRGEGAADRITVRMNSLVYDGERISFSYEVENSEPAYPVLVAMEPRFLVNGAPVFLDEFKADGAEICMVPSPHVDVLPVQRNPVVRGGWSRIISPALTGDAACEMTLIVYRPKKAFAVVPEEDDPLFRLADCAPEQRAEIQDAADTYRSFRNAVLADETALDPEVWFRAGYSVVGGFRDPAEWIDPAEEGFDHLEETARITVAFRFDADLRQAFDFSGMEDIPLEDCTVRVSRFRLSPLTTEAQVYLIPRENTEEAARALARKYGPMHLTDAEGTPVEYAQMEAIYENTPWASQSDGQWRCCYMIAMPGLQAWPGSVGLTVNTGDLLRVTLPTAGEGGAQPSILPSLGIQ